MNGRLKKSKILLFVIAALLMINAIAPLASASDYAPYLSYAVDGRILPPSLTGDTSDWIEIAQHSGNSLIVRKDFISWNYFGQKNPAWNIRPFGPNTNYRESVVRTTVNNWFNYRPGFEDGLSPYARLRNYTLGNTSYSVLGSSNISASLYDGFSVPSSNQINFGDDIAFVLSYTEAANFISNSSFRRSIPNQIIPSGAIASSNYSKLTTVQNTWPDTYAMWLRSPGDMANTASALVYGITSGSSTDGRVYQININKLNNEYGLVYPALWVTSGIFGANYPISVNYYRDSIGAANLLGSANLAPAPVGTAINNVNLSLYAPAGYATPGARSGDAVVAARQNTVNVVYSSQMSSTVYVYYYKDVIGGTFLGMETLKLNVPAGLPITGVDQYKYIPAGYGGPGTISGELLTREPFSLVFVLYDKPIQRNVTVMHMFQRSLLQPDIYDFYAIDYVPVNDGDVIPSSNFQKLLVPGYAFQDANPPVLYVNEYNNIIIIRYKIA
jgi:hypothetical protein